MPILNQREYKLAKARFAKLERALGPASVIMALATTLSEDARDARHKALAQEIAKLREEIAAYEKLSNQTSETVIHAEELGLIPIIGRISRQLTQRQFAELLGLKPQQIQRYESERYSGISLSRYQRALDVLGIKLDSKFQLAQVEIPEKSEIYFDLSFEQELLREIKKRKWIKTKSTRGQDDLFKELLSHYVAKGLKLATGQTLYRRALRDHVNHNHSAIMAWTARVLCRALNESQNIKRGFDFSDMHWLRDLTSLSQRSDGPRRAVKLLNEHGIAFVAERHLPHTQIDGAAFRLANGVPVIAMTMRYDRIDYFWFTLLHELAHIFLHLNRGLDDGFIDNLDFESQNEQEKEADSFARTTLISDERWSLSPARFSKSIDLIKSFAASQEIHVAIVAGRIRHERKDYKIFNEWIGQGDIRHFFYDE